MSKINKKQAQETESSNKPKIENEPKLENVKEEEIIEVKVEKEEEICAKSNSNTSTAVRGKIEKKNGINSRMLWKLVRMKYIPRIEIRLCKKCANALYYNKYKFTEKDNGKIGINFDLCENCAKLNMCLKDFLCEWDEKNEKK
ncbi:hypothetical protein ACQ4LE_001308 [Meloidogyne hapla]|uniref:Uncharacterized protein n=1 Tax=Meloidogyne hapla TaxID=6305 RepID=A0A1I8BVH3_MELHA